MHCIDFFVISKFCVKQLAIFERTVVAASDLKKLYDGQLCFSNTIIVKESVKHWTQIRSDKTSDMIWVRFVSKYDQQAT